MTKRMTATAATTAVAFRVATAMTMTMAIAMAMAMAGCSGDDDDENSQLAIAWKFEGGGDCASNGIDKVRVTLTPAGGAATVKEIACSAGSADFGKISAPSYSVLGEGLDAAGKTRFTSTQSASFPDGKIFGPLDMTLRPAPGKVTVTWNGCPPGIILPYQVSLYRTAPDGTPMTTTTAELRTQEACSASKATIDNVAPGSYVAEVDSRAQSPKVKGTQPVTVKAGDEVEVAIPVPN